MCKIDLTSNVFCVNSCYYIPGIFQLLLSNISVVVWLERGERAICFDRFDKWLQSQ